MSSVEGDGSDISATFLGIGTDVQNIVLHSGTHVKQASNENQERHWLIPEQYGGPGLN